MDDLKPLLIPAKLRDELAVEAAREGVSLEDLGTQAVEGFLESIKTRAFFEERRRNADPEWLMRFLDRDDGDPPESGDELPHGYNRTR